MHVINQGYEQFYQSISDRLIRAYNLSTLIAVNETINRTLQYAKDDDIKEQLKRFETVSNYTYALEMSYESCEVVYFIDDSFLISTTQTGRYRRMNLAREASWYDRLIKNNGRAIWVNFSDSSGFESEDSIALVRIIWDERDYSNVLGVVAIILPKESLCKLMTNSDENQYIYLMSNQGELLVENKTMNKLFSVTKDHLVLSKNTFVKSKLKDTVYLLRSDKLEGSKVYLVSVLPEEKINRALVESAKKVVFIYLLITLLILIIVFPLTQSITKRIRMLRYRMSQIQEGTILKLGMEPHKDEIGELITSYDQMVEELQTLLEQQYKLGQEKVGAEMKALQSQINPHFLYNTLDMINWMAQKNETENIKGVIQALSMFYRLTLSKGKDILTIREEVKLCYAYMEIQRRRFRGRIRFEEEIQEDILDCLIPKITLQPLIENAIIHGICEKEEGRGVVMLTGWQEGGRIFLNITDDGVGMKEDTLDHSGKTGSHYGLKNIEKRLSIFFEETIVLQMNSSPGIGTCITIEIPIRKAESME
jgi:two-component system sensor histidine kinase YesM